MTEEVRRYPLAVAGFALIAIGIIAIIAAFIIWPQLLENLLYALLVVVGVIVAVVICIFVIAAVLAVPMYYAKGEHVQSGVDYSIEDLKTPEDRTEPTDSKRE